MNKWKFALVFLAAAIASAYASGGQEGPTTATVTFMSVEADLPKDFVDSFNGANPDINLVRVEENWEKWLTEAMAGSAPDLARMRLGAEVPYFSRRGQLFDLTAHLKKSEVVKWDDIDKLGNSSYQFDGTEFGKGSWYGLVKDYNNIACITYNKEMFKKAGIAELSTVNRIAYDNEFYDLAKKLTVRDGSGNVVLWGTEFASNWLQFMASDMANSAGSFFYSDKSCSAMNNDPKMRAVWKYWARFQVEDIASNTRNPAAGWTGAAFQSDRVAMVQLGYWFGAQLMENPDYQTKYGWAPTPVLRKGAKAFTNNGGGTGIVIYAKTKYPDRAFRVFEWYIGGEYGLHRAKTGWGIPPLMSLRKYLPQDNEYNRSRTQIAFEDAKIFAPWMASTLVRTRPVISAAWNNNIDDLVLGKIDADAFVDRFYAQIDEELRVGKEELGL